MANETLPQLFQSAEDQREKCDDSPDRRRKRLRPEQPVSGWREDDQQQQGDLDAQTGQQQAVFEQRKRPDRLARVATDEDVDHLRGDDGGEARRRRLQVERVEAVWKLNIYT